MSHIWETPTFLAHLYRAPYVGVMFDRYVMRYVPNGDPNDNEMPGLNGLTFPELAPFKTEGAAEWAELAEGNQVRSFIVTPRNVNWGPPGELRYKDFMEEIQEYLELWVPNSRPQILSYPQDLGGVPKEVIERESETTAKGKVLFQYDPDQRTKTVEQEGGGECEVQVSALRLFDGADPVPK